MLPPRLFKFLCLFFLSCAFLPKNLCFSLFLSSLSPSIFFCEGLFRIFISYFSCPLSLPFRNERPNLYHRASVVSLTLSSHNHIPSSLHFLVFRSPLPLPIKFSFLVFSPSLRNAFAPSRVRPNDSTSQGVADNSPRKLKLSQPPGSSRRSGTALRASGGTLPLSAREEGGKLRVIAQSCVRLPWVYYVQTLSKHTHTCILTYIYTHTHI